MIDVSDLIGARYISKGRGLPAGFDCYGLVIEVSKRFGHTLRDFQYCHSNPKTFGDMFVEEGIELSESFFCEVAAPEESDIVVFFENGRGVHIAVMLDDENFIHADIGGVCVLKLLDYYRKDFKVYRWLK